jgi:cell division protein FtsL
MMSRNSRKKPWKLKEMGIWIIFMVFFISELFLYTWSRVQCVGIGYEISKAASHHKELKILRKNMKIELASLKSPVRIAEIAKNRFGLTMPTPEQMIIIP